MGVGDGGDDGQPKPGPVPAGAGFAACEPVEQTGLFGDRDARAAVVHPEPGVAVGQV